MTCSVTKAKAIHFIDGMCHVQKWKSCKTTLSGYYAWLSFNLLLMPSRADTLIHQCSWTIKKPGMQGLKAKAHLV